MTITHAEAVELLEYEVLRQKAMTILAGDEWTYTRSGHNPKLYGDDYPVYAHRAGGMDYVIRFKHADAIDRFFNFRELTKGEWSIEEYPDVFGC